MLEIMWILILFMAAALLFIICRPFYLLWYRKKHGKFPERKPFNSTYLD